ncbi:MAG: hypothetical protein ACKVRP_00725, partial [Bacteroidota bacterium]
MTTSFTPSTHELLSAIDMLSAHTLTRKNDLGTIIEQATQNNARQTLDELAFLAKFVVKAHGIMKRIGREAEGYAQLSSEFSANLEKATALTKTLISTASSNVQQHFDRTYFVSSLEGLQNLLALFHDLS